MSCIALHGFLGRPSDWETFPFCQPFAIQSAPNFEAWATDFNAWVKKNSSPPRTLLAYSMGGRLGLHALLQQPALWSRAILISTHPGLTCLKEKKQRLYEDDLWADRFLHLPWSNLMETWEAQAVFRTSPHQINREENNYQRAELARQLRSFSLGHQNDLRPQIQKLSLPIYWITGEEDTKFTALAREIASSHPFSSHIAVPSATHRVLWEKPDFLHHFWQNLSSRSNL
jgi:2-succinyl-6-hydroxy-2,4-cyclohexadiene-1-carboxylate synthase